MNNKNKMTTGGKITCGLLILMMAVFCGWSMWWNGWYTNFDTYCDSKDYVPVLFEVEEGKSVKAITRELYDSGLYPADMPYEALANEVSRINRLASDSFSKPEYIIAPMPREKVKR